MPKPYDRHTQVAGGWCSAASTKPPAHAGNLNVHARAGQLALGGALLQRRAVRVGRRQLALGRLPADDLPRTRMHLANSNIRYASGVLLPCGALACDA